MRRPIMIYNQFDILVVPFPFVDSPKSKPRPVVIVTKEAFHEQNAHCVAAMITTASHSQWCGDTLITDLAMAGLHCRSYIRLKLFTLDRRIGARKIGTLSQIDRQSLSAILRDHILS